MRPSFRINNPTGRLYEQKNKQKNLLARRLTKHTIYIFPPSIVVYLCSLLILQLYLWVFLFKKQSGATKYLLEMNIKLTFTRLLVQFEYEKAERN